MALRPEKIELHKRGEGERRRPLEDAPAGHNVVAGVIRHIAYLGGESVYEVEVEGGRR